VLKSAPVLAVSATLGIGALAGSADAYLSASSSGSVRAGVGSLKPVVVERATAVPGQLFPGQSSELSLRIKNPNRVTLRLVGVSQGGGGTAVAVVPATASCTGASAGVSIAPMVAGGLTGHILVARGITTVVVPTGVAMSITSPSSCQTKAFHIRVVVAVRS
jgi:hypothetical protein